MKQNRLTLNDVEWKAFSFNEVFRKIQRGKRLKKDDHIEGYVPYISSTALNNGVDGFIGNKEKIRKFSHNLTLANSGSVGSCFYHDYEYIASDHVTSLSLRNSNKYLNLFIATIVRRLEEKYSFNREINDKRIRSEKLMLPVDDKGSLNYQFMEDYIKQEQKEIAQKVINFYEQKLLETGFDLVGLEEVEWEVFPFDKIFRKIQRGRRLKKDDHIDGDVPYVSSTSLNNGVDGFICNDDKVRKFKNNLTLANSGSVGSCFYHDYEYIASDHVTSLTLENADKYIYLFMATIVKRLEEKYSFNREINDKRIRTEKLILPVDENGNPHWDYMSKFMQKIEAEKLEKALEYVKS